MDSTTSEAEDRRRQQNRAYYEKNKDRLKQKRSARRCADAQGWGSSAPTPAVPSPLIEHMEQEEMLDQTSDEPWTVDELRALIQQELHRSQPPPPAPPLSSGGLDLSVVLPLLGVCMYAARNPQAIRELVVRGAGLIGTLTASDTDTGEKKTEARHVDIETLTGTAS
jgi:hypothetical protein